MFSVRLTRVVAGVFLSMGQAAVAQQAPVGTPSPEAHRPGRYRLGPIYLTPRLRIGTIGLDTNVFYTATDRRADISASGGPGLDLVLPIRRNLRLTVGGGVGYLYFVRTESQRRLTGDASTTLEWLGIKTELRLLAGAGRSFARPSADVDRRMQQDTKQVGARAKRRLFGRTSVAVGGGVSRHDVEDGQEFLGTDLGRTLSRDVTSVEAALEYALTVKTRLALEGRLQRDAHRLDRARDTDRLVAAAGIHTTSTVLFSGRLLFGATWMRPVSQPRWQPSFYADVDATWHVSPRTRLGAGYLRDWSQTAFIVASGSPSAQRESVAARIEKDLHRNIDLWIGGRRTRLVTDHPVRLTLASGDVEAVRDDVARELTANLGYRFRRSFRLGAQAGYSDRQSSIADLGVKGLLLGGTVSFDP